MDTPAYSSNMENLLDYLSFCGLALAGEPDAPPSRLSGCWEQLALRETATLESGLALALPTLKKALSLGDREVFCVALSLCCELDGGLRERVQALSGAPLPTFDLALALFSQWGDATADGLFALPDPAHSPLRFLLDLEAARKEGEPLLFSRIRLRPVALRYLTTGRISGGARFRVFRDCPPAPPLLHGRLFSALSAYTGAVLSGELRRTLLLLAGAPGSGKKHLMRRLCAEQGLLRIQYRLGPESSGRDQALELAFCAALPGALVCFTGYAPSRLSQLEGLLEELPPSGVPVAVLSDDPACEAPLLPCGWDVLPRQAPELDAGDFRAIWAARAAEYGLSGQPHDLPALRLNAGQIGRLFARARLLQASGDAGGERALMAAVRELNAPCALARAGQSSVSLADVLVPAETERMLRLICSYARHADRVRLDWAGAPPAGKGLTALLCGAPGTGKTMAASAIANELGFTLLRVDLSQILDKYIGETEKRLSAIFAAARAGNYILFFDEADALFSRRTEISSSHDRYANAETAFLLQSIEEYDGVVLLATNLMKNFDEAFLRRIQVMVRFPMPDEEMRLRHWRSAFSGPQRLAADVDFPALAQALEFSPATIRSAAFCACVMAAGEGGEVRMAHILSALRCELEKYGNAGSVSALEELAR